MTIAIKNKTMRFLLYLDPKNPTHIPDLAAYVYERKDLAMEEGPSLGYLYTNLGNRIANVRNLLKAVREKGWHISHDHNYLIDPAQAALLRRAEASYRQGIYWNNTRPLTPEHLAEWLDYYGVIA